MRYRVLVEVLKPAFAWIEVDDVHLLDSIGVALEKTLHMAPQEFADSGEIDPCIGPNGCDSVLAPFALLVIDPSGNQLYSRVDQADELRALARLEAEGAATSI